MEPCIQGLLQVPLHNIGWQKASHHAHGCYLIFICVSFVVPCCLCCDVQILGALLVGECFSILALAMTVQQHTSQWCQQVVLGQDVRYAHPAPSLMP